MESQRKKPRLEDADEQIGDRLASNYEDVELNHDNDDQENDNQAVETRQPELTTQDGSSALGDQRNEEDTTEKDVGNSSPEEKPVYLDYKDEYQQIMLDDARSYGFWPWIQKYGRTFEIADLFKVFDYELPPEMINEDAEVILPLLKAAFEEKASKRTRLEHLRTVDDAVELIRKSKNILVLTGAGVSVSCGIPDFRSKNGIYARLQEFELSDPQEMFDLSYFRERPDTFYSFALEIYPSNFEPSICHKFIKKLEEKGKLLRNYTQNIDTLEKKCGINRVVQCHGSFATASCIKCKYQVPGSSIEEYIFKKQVPKCKKCKDDELGIIKPDIVFFGEDLPNTFHSSFKEDREKVDLLIVIGSSLRVAPVGNVKDRIPVHVPQILINMESLSHMERFDIHLLGNCDTIAKTLSQKLGWEDCDSPDEINYEPGPLPWIWYFEGAIRKENPKEYSYQLNQTDSSDEDSDESDSLKGDYVPPDSPPQAQ